MRCGRCGGGRAGAGPHRGGETPRREGVGGGKKEKKEKGCGIIKVKEIKVLRISEFVKKKVTRYDLAGQI